MQRPFENIIMRTMAMVVFAMIFFCANAQIKPAPGTIMLRDGLFIDAKPVLNIHYREYYYSMRDLWKYNLDTLEKIAEALPAFGFDLKQVMKERKFKLNPDSNKFIIDRNSTRWMNKKLSYWEYTRLPEYNYYPFVGASYILADSYCRWRTAMVRLLYASKSEAERKAFNDHIQYRLPTKEEMENAAVVFGASNRIKLKTGDGKSFASDFSLNEVDNAAFFVTGLSEIVLDNNAPRSLRWNIIDPKSTSIKPKITTRLASDIAFRCVCEIK